LSNNYEDSQQKSLFAQTTDRSILRLDFLAKDSLEIRVQLLELLFQKLPLSGFSMLLLDLFCAELHPIGIFVILFSRFQDCHGCEVLVFSVVIILLLFLS